jgi:hypothetical protein
MSRPRDGIVVVFCKIPANTLHDKATTLASGRQIWVVDIPHEETLYAPDICAPDIMPPLNPSTM